MGGDGTNISSGSVRMSLGDLSDPKAKNHVVSLHAVATLAAVWIMGCDPSGWASIHEKDLLEPLLNSGRGRGFGCQQEGPDSWGSYVLAPAWLRTAHACFCELRVCHSAPPRGQMLCVCQHVPTSSSPSQSTRQTCVCLFPSTPYLGLQGSSYSFHEEFVF